MNKNNVNAYKPKLRVSVSSTELRKIPFVKSITHSKAFCLPVGFSFKFRENANTTANTIMAATNPEMTFAVLNVRPRNWKVEIDSPPTEYHLFST